MTTKLIRKTLRRKPSCKETPIERALLKMIGENPMILRELAKTMMIEETPRQEPRDDKCK